MPAEDIEGNKKSILCLSFLDIFFDLTMYECMGILRMINQVPRSDFWMVLGEIFTDERNYCTIEYIKYHFCVSIFCTNTFTKSRKEKEYL